MHIIDCRLVLTWKWELPATSANAPEDSSTAKARKVIRAILTVRGFMDLDAGTIESYAGTSQRYSQRVLVSEAVCREWDICATDISNALLQ